MNMPPNSSFILDTTVRCLSMYGEQRTTFKMISEKCQVSESYISKFFGKKENLIPYVGDYIQTGWVAQVKKIINSDSSAVNIIKSLLKYRLQRDTSTTHLFTISIYLYLECHRNDRHKKFYSDLKKNYEKFIYDLIRKGEHEGSFNCHHHAKITARLIHDMMIGTSIGITSLENKFSNKSIMKNLEKNIFKILNYQEQ